MMRVQAKFNRVNKLWGTTLDRVKWGRCLVVVQRSKEVYSVQCNVFCVLGSARCALCVMCYVASAFHCILCNRNSRFRLKKRIYCTLCNGFPQKSILCLFSFELIVQSAIEQRRTLIWRDSIAQSAAQEPRVSTMSSFMRRQYVQAKAAVAQSALKLTCLVVFSVNSCTLYTYFRRFCPGNPAVSNFSCIECN